jgi:hypothetical protein
LTVIKTTKAARIAAAITVVCETPTGFLVGQGCENALKQGRFPTDVVRAKNNGDGEDRDAEDFHSRVSFKALRGSNALDDDANYHRPKDEKNEDETEEQRPMQGVLILGERLFQPVF